jgi:hypothetical protein
VTITVTDITGAPVTADPGLALTVSSSPAGTCTVASLSTVAPVTNSSGVGTSTYTASGTIGFCTITAKDTSNTTGASTAINQHG